MKTFRLLFIPFIILLCFNSCSNVIKEKVTSIPTSQSYNKVPLDPKGDSIIIKKFDYNTMYLILGQIQDSSADKYYKKYSDTYKPQMTGGLKFPFSFVITKDIGAELKKRVNSGELHLLLTTRNNGLDILFVDANNKKYYITNTPAIKLVTEEEFIKMDENFKSGIYNEMNNTKMKLVGSEHTGNSSYGNTTEIIIPYKDFVNYDPEKHTLVFLPATVTDVNSVNSKNQSKMHHFTLIMTLVEISQTKALKAYPTVFYDDFCLKPPGC